MLISCFSLQKQFQSNKECWHKGMPSDRIRQMRRLFDVYLAVDWSARSKPSPAAPAQDALWVGEAFAPGVASSATTGETYWRTRHTCVDYLYARLLEHIQAGVPLLDRFGAARQASRYLVCCR
jgi:hypothetical protein